jgi:hypothetical protein
MGFFIVALIHIFISVIKRARGCVGIFRGVSIGVAGAIGGIIAGTDGGLIGGAFLGILIGVISSVLSGSVSTGIRVSLTFIVIGGVVGAIIGTIFGGGADHLLWKISLGIVIVIAMTLVRAFFTYLGHKCRVFYRKRV